MKTIKALVGIVMGSKSDLPVMKEAAEVLAQWEIPYEISIVSAHRTPLRLMEYGQSAVSGGLKVIIAGAGGAAHLPGMLAALTPLPVIGVPVKSRNSLDGWDSILSILQMPNGVPVATVALNAAKNAGILAAQILAIQDETLLQKITEYKQSLSEQVLKDAREVENGQNPA